MSDRACKNCHMIVKGDVCPVCNSSDLSGDWSGYVIVLDPEGSAIAKRLNIKQGGKYALKVR